MSRWLWLCPKPKTAACCLAAWRGSILLRCRLCRLCTSKGVWTGTDCQGRNVSYIMLSSEFRYLPYVGCNTNALMYKISVIHPNRMDIQWLTFGFLVDKTSDFKKVNSTYLTYLYIYWGLCGKPLFCCSNLVGAVKLSQGIMGYLNPQRVRIFCLSNRPSWRNPIMQHFL